MTRWGRCIFVRRDVLPPVIYGVFKSNRTQCAWIGEKRRIRTIRRVATVLVVVYKRTRSGTRAPGPARVENVVVFVLPEHQVWVDPVRSPDDDFISLGGPLGNGRVGIEGKLSDCFN